MKRGHVSGWRSAEQRKGCPPQAMPIVPALWDVFLERRGWTLEQALNSAEARSYASTLRNKHYLPEAALRAWGWLEGM